MNLPLWLKTESERLAALLDRGQLPHAVLIHGPVGVGRRLLAFWLMEQLLEHTAGSPDPTRLGAGRIDEELLPVHPDFRLLQPLEDKKTISVAQVRELIEFLALTSHQSGAKVVIVAPAQAMTISAANCLLKTLEEPATNSFLILVADSLSRLPATIVSRCQRVRVALPDRQVAGKWLHGLEPDVDWQAALELSAGAPLAALEWQQIEFPQLVAKMTQDLSALQQRTKTPANVAKRWVKYDPEPCLRWLFNQLSAEIRTQIARHEHKPIAKPEVDRLQKSGETLNMESSFTVLRQIGELRRIQGSGLNFELHLTDVLTRWYAGD